MIAIILLIAEQIYTHTVKCVLLAVGDSFDDRVKIAAFVVVSWTAISSLEWPVALLVTAGIVVPLAVIGRALHEKGRSET